MSLRIPAPRPSSLALGALLLLAAAPVRPRAAAADQAEPVPVLVELFTSEGCSSCPPADALVAELAASQPIAGARVVALGYHVTYWDRLGWRDRFSDPAWTRRQDDYARRFGLASVYTPQAVVDGRHEMVASRRGELTAAVADSARRPRVPLELDVRFDGDELATRVGAPDGIPEAGAELWVALSERGLVTDVERGENASRRLRHVAVVRVRESLGVVPSGAPIRPRTLRWPVDPEWRRDRLAVVAVLQRPGPGEILAVSAVDPATSR